MRADLPPRGAELSVELDSHRRSAPEESSAHAVVGRLGAVAILIASLLATYFVSRAAEGFLALGLRLVLDVLLFAFLWLLLGRGDRAQARYERHTRELSKKYARLDAELKEKSDCAARETAEARQRSETLRKSEERSRLLIEYASDAIFIHDDTGRFLEVNRRACESVGYTKEELLARSVTDIDPSVESQSAGEIWRALVPGQARVIQTHHQCKDGTRSPVEVRLSAYEFEGKRQILAMTTDRSQRDRIEVERERLHAQLQQAQKMEAIGRLAGGIAHDFNNILASILGYTGLARECVGSDGDKQLLSYLQQINKAGERARDLIAQMLTFSRARSSERKVVSMAREIREVIRMLSATIPSSISIQTRIDQDTPPILINAVQLHQVIMNLCVNARDSINGRGRIDIELLQAHGVTGHCASCHSAVTGDFVVLRVRDNGTGIPAAILPRIFEPFFSTKGVGKGTGLGLPVVHGIVHEHGGHIRIDSELERGTAFELLFRGVTEPVKNPSDSSSNPALPALVRGRGTILVVDDEQQLRQLMTELLERQGYEVITVADGDEALRCVEKDPLAIDLVITDQTMPNMTGTALITALRKLRSNLQIILYSGYCDPELEENVKRLEVLAFLLKPVRLGELLAYVKNVLSP